MGRYGATRAVVAVDELAVEHALDGRPVRLNTAERAEVATRLAARGQGSAAVAQVLGVSQGAAQVLCRRARERMRRGVEHRVYTIRPPAGVMMDWTERAACARMDEHMRLAWWATEARIGSAHVESLGQARRVVWTAAPFLLVCETCPVLAQCREWAGKDNYSGIAGRAVVRDGRPMIGRLFRSPARSRAFVTEVLKSWRETHA